MSDCPRLERRYRRLLGVYPKAFRREHEQEILSVLLAGSAEGQRHPRWAESVNLLRNAVFMHVRHTKLPSSWESRHARVMVPVRIAIGIWLLVLTAIMYAYGVGGWWGALLLPSAALHFFLAYRLTHTAKR